MRPGDVVECDVCGAPSEPAHCTGGRPFDEGGAVIVTWLNGPYPRHTAARADGTPPSLCLWCDDKRLGIPPPITVPLPPGFRAREAAKPPPPPPPPISPPAGKSTQQEFPWT
jgi:hypothetical protein